MPPTKEYYLISHINILREEIILFSEACKRMARERLDDNLRQLQAMVEDCVSCHEVKIPVEHRSEWRQTVKDNMHFLTLDSPTMPSPSHVLQVVLSAIADFQSNELSSLPLNPSAGNFERNVENEISEEEESAIIAMEIRPGQTSEFCEIDNMFGLFKKLLARCRKESE